MSVEALARPAAGSPPVRDRILQLRDGLSPGLIGADKLVEGLLVGLLTGGPLVIGGAPGLAKTRAVKRLSDGLDGSFARVQCTPDLMPADLTGTTVWRQDAGTFEFLPGPLF